MVLKKLSQTEAKHGLGPAVPPFRGESDWRLQSPQMALVQTSRF